MGADGAAMAASIAQARARHPCLPLADRSSQAISSDPYAGTELEATLTPQPRDPNSGERFLINAVTGCLLV